jgi:hypothetical protein
MSAMRLTSFIKSFPGPILRNRFIFDRFRKNEAMHKIDFDLVSALMFHYIRSYITILVMRTCSCTVLREGTSLGSCGSFI